MKYLCILFSLSFPNTSLCSRPPSLFSLTFRIVTIQMIQLDQCWCYQLYIHVCHGLALQSCSDFVNRPNALFCRKWQVSEMKMHLPMLNRVCLTASRLLPYEPIPDYEYEFRHLGYVTGCGHATTEVSLATLQLNPTWTSIV